MKNKIYLLGLILSVVLNANASEVTNTVSITTNLTFSVSSYRHDLFPAAEFKSDEMIYWGLLGTSTNRIWYRHFPSGNFDFHLFDEHRKEVPKTKAGLDFTGTPPKPTVDDLANTRKFAGYSVDNKQGEYRRLFRPDDMFEITNKGTYDLEIQMRLCVIMTNGTPDLNAMIDARNVTQRGWQHHGFVSANDFGVLTSPPLHVKVIKE